MAQLAEAYIHLKPYSFSTRRARSFGPYLDKLATRAARKIYDQRVAIDVEIEAGSLKTWVTVSGLVIGALYHGVSEYPDFKKGAHQLVQDARTFATSMYEPFLHKTKADSNAVYRFERRLKTPGKVYRLIKHLEKLESSVDQLSPNDVKEELARARNELESIEQDLTPEETAIFQKQITPLNLPPPPNWPIQLNPPKVAVKSDDDVQPSLFSPELGFTVPAKRRTPETRTIYQHRTILERKSSPTRRPEDDGAPLLR